MPSHIEKIELRADSGFFGSEIIEFLLNASIEFCIVVQIQSWIQKKVRQIGDWTSIDGGDERQSVNMSLRKISSLGRLL